MREVRMIMVVGTKRSGTSMWMQILKGAGLEILGDPFMGSWGDSIREANQRGFYESPLRQGIFFATNPNPETGAYLFPQHCKDTVVKVFIPGLVRSDYAFVDRVIGTMRHWSEYGPSLRRLYALEDDYLATQEDGEARLSAARAVRGALPPEVEWWFENFELIRDAATRRYAFNLCTYDRLLEDPAPILSRVLKWIGAGELAGGLDAIEGSLRTQKRAGQGSTVLDAKQLEIFEAFYNAAHSGLALSPSLITEMNLVQDALVERYGRLDRDRGREAPEQAPPSLA